MGYAGAEVRKNHLKFNPIPPEGLNKMPRYEVWNSDFHSLIGIIHFRGGWRQYVFQALPEVDMSRGCHKEIDNFIDKIMREWKEENKAKGNKRE
jgi:hypothetical protein